jgi:hypothetical protein
MHLAEALEKLGKLEGASRTLDASLAANPYHALPCVPPSPE